MPPDDEGGIRPEVTRAKITAVTSASFKPVGSVLYDYEVTQIETPDGKILPHRISGEKLDNGPSSGASVTVGQMFGGVKPGTRVRIAQRVKTGAGTSDVLRNYDRLERERDWL